jgi:hypothetical protein
LYTFAIPMIRITSMDKLKYGLLLVGFIILLISCETDFETNAEWKDITVVYGLLDQRDSVQYIKINKAFLGEGDALMFAKENDSINYPFPLNVWLEEWDANGNKLQTIIEFDTATSYKPDDPNAVFNTGAQRIYKGVPTNYGVIGKPYEIRYIVQPPNDTIGFEKIWLNEKSTYKLFIQYPDSSKLITSETYLVEDFKMTKPFAIINGEFIKFSKNPIFPTQFGWEKAPNDDNKFKYEFQLIFNYRELTFDGQLIDTSLILASGEVYSQEGSSELYYYYSENNFYTTCYNSIPYNNSSDEANIKERYTGPVDIIVAAAAAEFNLFMEVYEPSTSIVQEKPPYTNIVNGIGIFSSRYYIGLNKKLHQESIAGLQEMDDNILKFAY